MLAIVISFEKLHAKRSIKAKLEYRLKITNIMCHGDENYIVNLTCFIKAGREKAGYLTVKALLSKPLDNFTVEFRHLFKPNYGRNPQYRPYYFNLDVDWYGFSLFQCIN